MPTSLAPAVDPKPVPFVPFRRTGLVLATVFVLDLFGLGVGLISLATALIGTALLLLGGTLALGRSLTPLARNRFLRAGIYAALGLFASLTSRLEAALARRHAAQVVAACCQYRAARGAYPNRLEDLVPHYLPAVPPVNHALMTGPFRYSSRTGGVDAPPLLWYVDVPGASRQVYNFGTDRWTHQD